MADNTAKTAGKPGSRTRAKLKFLDGVSALSVLLLALEYLVFEDSQYSAVALWLLIAVILASQVIKRRLSCPNCGAGVYAPWHYGYRSKVPDNCSHCGKPLP